MKIGYFDCFSGISGNMVLGALVDAGVDVERLRRELEKLPVSGYELTSESVQRGGLTGIHVEIQVQEQQPERHLHEIEDLIESSGLHRKVKNQGLSIFRHLAQAEARVHSVPVDQVHFHEVGAVDAIVDVMGSVIGLSFLGVEQVYASPIRVGRGAVVCAHGTLPVPAPATLELLRGVPIYGRDVEAELVTPTGAAILTTLAQGFGAAPSMTIERIGYGAGSRELPHPNLLRVSIGTVDEAAGGYEEDEVAVIETNIDDMPPEWYEYVTRMLFEAGALDVFLTPIQMKRGRPATQISVLTAERTIQDVVAVLFAETTTIGVRLRREHRYKLSREVVVVDTAYGPIAVKVARHGGRVVNVAPEHGNCQRAAEEQGTSIKAVHQATLAAALSQIEHG